jgi:hypothetical protein
VPSSAIRDSSHAFTNASLASRHAALGVALINPAATIFDGIKRNGRQAPSLAREAISSGNFLQKIFQTFNFRPREMGSR